jgi:hypothetical protein
MTLTHFIEMPHFEPRLFKIDTNKLPTCMSVRSEKATYIYQLACYIFLASLRYPIPLSFSYAVSVVVLASPCPWSDVTVDSTF